MKKPKCLCGEGAGKPTVTTKQGRMTGRSRFTANGRPFTSFTRIPFAEPPVGPLRFRLPVPAGKWARTLDAGKPCPKPIQSNYVTGILEGQEDCLYINVYRPEPRDIIADGSDCRRDDGALLPVMYWVYGGGFIMGDATEENYLPGPLIDQGEVIVVSANYRVGPLGFMSLEDDVAPGNVALWDQRLALTWVQDNIRQFGGDPDNVTVFGESAGSYCVMALYVSPQCRGLFHKAVAQSGPLLSNSSATITMGKRPRVYARSFAQALGCGADDTSEQILAQLQELPVGKLQEKFSLAGDWDVAVPCPWKPVVDTWSSNPFLPNDPRAILISGEFSRVPLLHGICGEEGVMMVSHLVKEPKRWALLKESWWQYISIIAFHNHWEDINQQDRNVIERIKEEYLGEKDVDEETIQQLIDLFTDAYFKAGTLETCRILATHGVPAFQYRFCFEGAWKFADLLTMSAGQLALKLAMAEVGVTIAGPDVGGVCHAEELHYLFSPTMPGLRNTLPTDRDKDMSKKMAHQWTNFARFGNPSIDSEPDWVPVTPDSTSYMELNQKNVAKDFTDEEMRRYNMWMEIFSERRNLSVPNSSLVIKQKHILRRENKSLFFKDLALV